MMNFLSNKSDLHLIEDIENKDLLFISHESNIPSVNRGLVFSLKLDERGRISMVRDNMVPDPSTIYVKLPVRKPYSDVPGLSYYPHYIELLPEQRYVYLNWLRNVDYPIDTGYVFLYYYGLERQLLVGNFEKAFNQIIRLRNAHKNKSFQNYSEAALIHACIMRDKIDSLLDLEDKAEISGFSNVQFLLALNSGINLGAENLIAIFKKAIKLAAKPIQEDYWLLLEQTRKALLFKYQQESFPFAHQFDISKAKSRVETRFANYTFPVEIQRVEITDFYSFKPLMAEIDTVFRIAYDAYKKEKAIQKKAGMGELSDNELKIKQFKSDIRRYDKLLKEKKINQIEYELLKKYASDEINNLMSKN